MREDRFDRIGPMGSGHWGFAFASHSKQRPNEEKGGRDFFFSRKIKAMVI